MSRTPPSWDEAFSHRYDEWAAPHDRRRRVLRRACPCCGRPARRARGRERPRRRSRSRRRPAGRSSASTPRPRCSSRRGAVRPRRASSSTCIEGDMRELALDEPAALIYCPFRALLHLPTWADRRRTFERVAASLRPGGRFAWNAFAFDHSYRRASSTAPTRTSPCRTPSATPSATTASTSRSTTAARARCGGRPRTSGSGSLDVAGLEVESLHGGFAGEPFTDESREYVFVATRRYP